MAIRNINAFKTAKNANDAMVNASVNAKKLMLLSLLDEIKPFVSELQDIRDTFYAVKRESKEYAENVLWYHLIGYNKKDGYTKDYHIDCNSYFGVRSQDSDYYVSVNITRKGLAIYYDPNTHKYIDDWNDLKWSADNAEEYIRSNDFSEKILDMYINSVKQLMQYFPGYAEQFFNLVENPKF